MTIDIRYLSHFDRFYNFNFNYEGIKSYARESNQLIKEWVENEKDNRLLQNINCISIDFVNDKVITPIIEYNRRLLLPQN